MKDETLPEEYVPSMLRAPEPKIRELAYACGYETPKGEGSYGMSAGPFPSLEEALDVVPEDRGVLPGVTSFVIRFNEDGTEDLLYTWHTIKGAWKRWRPR